MSIRIVQERLRAAGYDPGPVDGAWGRKTADALDRALGLASDIVDHILIADLKRDEGLRLTAYKDSVGVWTVGYGHAHVAPGTVWTQAKAEAVLIDDVREHNRVIHAALPWLKRLDPVRRRVIENMHFNMGWDDPKTPQREGLSGFVNTLAHVEAGRYAQAAAGMRASLWTKQVKGRAERLAREMEMGRVAQ